MGFLDNMFKRKKENAPPAKDAPPSTDKISGDVFSDWDFQYSQSVYNRNLPGVLIFEIEAAPLAVNALRKELFIGEFIVMTEGRMSLGVRIKTCGTSLFDRRNVLSLSYSGHGESFFVEAKVIKSTCTDKEVALPPGAPAGGGSSAKDEAGTSGSDPERYKYYIVEMILCAEPIRHRRKHGRVAIEWNVYYRVSPGDPDNAAGDGEDSGYSVTKTIDISEGGFKSIVENRLAENTVIECVVEVDNSGKSEGALTGRVIRCDLMADSIEMFEMTVQFIAADESVLEFLAGCIEKEHPGAVDAEAKITLSGDCLEALIELSPPRNNGADLSYEALCARLASEGVTFGIDDETLRALAEKPYYNLESVIARGIAPTDGDDAVLTYFVEMNPVLAPKEYEDGTVDFKDIGLIRQINKDDVLAEKTPLTEGTPGTCVTGKVCEAIPGKDKKLPAGANTVVNESGTVLSAGIDGCVSIIDDKINVFSTFVVEGDVQYETGNISHNGTVIIKGDVRYGFTVDATGDIVIHGTVESAAITAGGSLVVQGGCVGEENAVETGGNVAIKFIDGGAFIIRGNLKTTYIINSAIKCGGTVDLIGSGIIRNSHVVAHTAVNAKSIGSVRAAADKTVVEVGNDPELLNRFVTVSKKLEQLEKDTESFETTIRALTIKKYTKELPDEKIKVLEKSKALVQQFRIQQEQLTDERRILKGQINELGYGIIRVQKTAYEGLRIIIGSSTLVLKDSVKAVKFYRNDDGVAFTSLV